MRTLNMRGFYSIMLISLYVVPLSALAECAITELRPDHKYSDLNGILKCLSVNIATLHEQLSKINKQLQSLHARIKTVPERDKQQRNILDQNFRKHMDELDSKVQQLYSNTQKTDHKLASVESRLAEIRPPIEKSENPKLEDMEIAVNRLREKLSWTDVSSSQEPFRGMCDYRLKLLSGEYAGEVLYPQRVTKDWIEILLTPSNISKVRYDDRERVRVGNDKIRLRIYARCPQ